MQAIETKYFGPGNVRGARVKAICQAGSITFHWDHAMNVDDNHRAAALTLAEKLDWVGGAAPGSRGYVFVNATWALSHASDHFTI